MAGPAQSSARTAGRRRLPRGTSLGCSTAWWASAATSSTSTSAWDCSQRRRSGARSTTPTSRPSRCRIARPVGSPVRLGYLGRLDPLKGIELLLDTLLGPLRSRPWTLAVAGRGSIAGRGAPEYESALLQRYRDPRIRFLGFVDPPSLLGDLDVLVVPSVWQEPFPRVTFEAYAHGVAVIGSRRGGIPEGIDDGRPACCSTPTSQTRWRAPSARCSTTPTGWPR